MILEFIHEPHQHPKPTERWWLIKYGLESSLRFGRRRLFRAAYKRAHLAARTAYEEVVAARSDGSAR